MNWIRPPSGGTVVILGEVGDNFAAGMTGGMAFVYDASGTFSERLNSESVAVGRLESDYWTGACRALIEEHVRETQSSWAERILDDWETERSRFWHVVPHEILPKLEHPMSDRAAEEAVPAAE